jgi:hypothetical protein
MLASIEALAALDSLTIGERVVVDTTQPVDTEALFQNVATAIGRRSCSSGRPGLARRSR